MIKMLFAFLLIFALVFVGIQQFRSLTKRKKWSLLRLITYSTICAGITSLFLVSIVILF